MNIGNRILKALLFLFFCGYVISINSQQYTPQRMRTVQNLNTDWKFIKQDVSGAQAASFGDGSWAAINLPHSLDIPYFRAKKAVPPYIGWYRKHYTVPQQAFDEKKRFTLEFEGSFLVTTVYVNGTQVGQHKGGYTPFSYDITGNLKAGDNTIAVRVDATWNRQMAPRSGDHVFIGGIYRNVSMIVTEPLHVDWYGTFVSTPTVSSSSATVKIKTDVVNSGSESKSCVLKTVVVDASGTIATSMESTQSIAAGATNSIVQTSQPISSPKLWSPQSPNLYKVYSEIYVGGRLVDNYETPFGIRSLSWSNTQGFSLNGQRLWLHGANAHQDHAGWYDAITDAGNERDVKLIKDCGMNFIRGSHYPHAPSFMDASDKLGVCIWAEMCLWFTPAGGDTTDWIMDGYPSGAADQASFDANALMQLREMIKTSRNHPSIIVWSMTNEPFFGGSESKIKELLKQMVDVSHSEDSTRLAAIGGCQRDGNLLPHYDDIGDVAGYNGDGAKIYMDPLPKPSVVTEYGSCGEDRPGNLTPCWGDVQNTNGKATEYTWRGGVAIWCAFHYGTWSAYGNSGMIDHARIPLRRWYYYRNQNLGTPYPTWPTTGTAGKLEITTDRDTVTDDGKCDAQVKVQIQDASGKWISNTADITLTTTNGLFPSQAPAGGTSITFTGGAYDKGVLEGMCAIEFRSYTAGSATLTATSGNLTATKTILVKHVENPEIVYLSTPVLDHQAVLPVKQIMRQIKFAGNSLVVPLELRGRNCSVSIYTLQGKLLNKYMLKNVKSKINVGNTATAALFARFTTTQ
jgi:beta-galactosidase